MQCRAAHGEHRRAPAIELAAADPTRLRGQDPSGNTPPATSLSVFDDVCGLPQAAVSSLCAAYPLAGLHTVRIHTDALALVETRHVWVPLVRLAGLRTLEVAVTRHAADVQPLSQWLARASAFPALEHLVLAGVLCGNEVDCCNAVRSLAGALAARRARGNHVKLLSISCCAAPDALTGFKKDLKKLEEQVDTIELKPCQNPAQV